MIQLQNVSKSFKDFKAVNSLSLEINKGEILGLLGANGAGKSTTINMLLGFLQPDSGSITVGEINVIDNAPAARKIIGYIPENVNLYPYLTGIENLDYFCKLSGLTYSSSDLSDILSSCGLQKNAHNTKVSGYSKGMRQKVGIAIAYAKNAEIYLLDEPASGLDPLASNELSVLLRELASKGATIVMASHDIFRVREVCDRIGILKNGLLVKELATKDVTASQLEKLYIDYMKN